MESSVWSFTERASLLKKKIDEICLSGLYQLCLSYVTIKMDIKHWIADVKYATGFSHMELKGQVTVRN